MTAQFPIKRLRRRRQTDKLRRFFSETEISVNDLIFPVFVTEKSAETVPISTMPGHFQWPISKLPQLIAEISEKKISSVLLFGIPKRKDSEGSGSSCRNNVIEQALQVFQRENADILRIADVCMCEYTDHGQCGVLDRSGCDVDNDATLPLLSKAALSYAQAGAEIIAPSDMMDGRVRAIREELDRKGLTQIPVVSYAAKFASSFYGPFREAAESAPRVGNRKSYQMNFANRCEALEEIETDLEEGSDGVIIKPAMPSLDVIQEAKQRFRCPITAYQVSGEFCMIQACSEKGWLDRRSAILESLMVIKRSGADRIISYFALEAAAII